MRTECYAIYYYYSTQMLGLDLTHPVYNITQRLNMSPDPDAGGCSC